MKISLDDLMTKIKTKISGKYDLVIAVSKGGILPGYLISRYLNLPLEIISLEFRNDTHKPKYKEPKLLKPISFKVDKKNIILVDDVSNTGQTLNTAKTLLNNCKSIETIVISGNADISLYGPHKSCIIWPWD